MAFDDLRLSLMAFPQRWRGTAAALEVRLLLLPVGSPLEAIDANWPAFAGLTFKLKATVIAGLDALPATGSPVALEIPFTAAPPANAAALYQVLLKSLPAGTSVTTAKPQHASDAVRVRKSLPASYTQAFPFEQPRNADLLVGDGYGCAVRAQDPGIHKPTPKKLVSWGQMLSYALRQPVLARALGLRYDATLTIPAGLLQHGGFIYFTLDTTPGANSYTVDWQANADLVKRYAARIPALAEHQERALFAAQLFPVVAAPGGDFDATQAEAEEYDDGFAKVVHCNQPATVDAATADPDAIAPGAEAGIQLGWDDEQVTVWFNRQLDLLRARASGAATDTPESPLGVQGYRVDVRRLAGPWRTLCGVKGDLKFSPTHANATGSTALPANTELWVEPLPVRASAATEGAPNHEPAWLPLYFAQWRGKSLVVHDDTVSKLTPGTTALPASFLSAVLTGVPDLRYGQDFQFRVRLTDLTGGGPRLSDDPVNPALAPIGTCHFLRHLPPKALKVDSTPGVPPLPATPPAVRTITNFAVRRPRIGYPEAIFAGVNTTLFTGSSLDALIADATAHGGVLDVPDPDVDRFLVRVEARMPAHDTGEPGTLPDEVDGLYRVIYNFEVPFVATEDDPDPAITLTLDYQEVDQIGDLLAPPTGSTHLPIPTARNVRVRLIPLCAPRPNYYGTASPPEGLATDFVVRKEASTETHLLPIDPVSTVKAIYLQPSDNQVQLLAQTLDLTVQELTLTGQPGVRTVFAGSKFLRHTLASDRSSITFANQAELLGHWVVALVFELDRDWTWDGFADLALTISRSGQSDPVANVSVPPTISQAALGNALHHADRTTTRIVCFDAIDATPATGAFPTELEPKWEVTPHLKKAGSPAVNYQTRLPITVGPAQTPRIVSTGLALSDYTAAPDYSATAPRQRFLWVEFDQPVADPEDTLYARVLAYGPDPVLAESLFANPLPDPVPPALPIDPEPIRVIVPGQSSDSAGLDAMTEMLSVNGAVAGANGEHYLLPLPPGITPEALELFGFWTYEFRVGHKTLWSTAQGRFGRPLVVGGVQHPAPLLKCAAQRFRAGVFVAAPYATTIANGSRCFDQHRGDPQTDMYVMLYAQVTQLDGSSQRNVLLGHRLASPRFPVAAGGNLKGVENLLRPTETRDVMASAKFPEDEIEEALRLLNLPRVSPLSVLAVELLPGSIRRSGLQVAEARDLKEDAFQEPVTDEAVSSGLGTRRILRTSPLTAVPAIC